MGFLFYGTHCITTYTGRASPPPPQKKKEKKKKKKKEKWISTLCDHNSQGEDTILFKRTKDVRRCRFLHTYKKKKMKVASYSIQ